MGGEGTHNPADLTEAEAALVDIFWYCIAIYGEVAGLDGDAMRGTDGAALAANYTAARAVYLDELAAGNIPADIDTLLARLTAARAGYLDELGPTNLPADIDAIIAALVVIEQETYEIEKHIHAHEKWMGAADSPSGETHVADRMGTAIIPFALLSGDDEFGGWIQVMGSEDSPVQAGMTRMDAHRVLVTTTDSTEPFVVQFVVGELADIGAKIAAEDFTEFAYISATNNADSGISDIISKRIPSGTKVWARCLCVDQANKTINLYVGLHEYVR